MIFNLQPNGFPLINFPSFCHPRNEIKPLSTHGSTSQAKNLETKKILYEKKWKRLYRKFEKNKSFDWTQSEKTLLNLLSETDPHISLKLKANFINFLSHLNPNETLLCLESIFLYGIEQNSKTLQSLVKESVKLSTFNAILKEKTKGQYLDLKSWINDIAKSLSFQTATSVKNAHLNSHSAKIITSFFPNLATTFLRAFNLFDSARPPESLFEYGTLVTLYFHFFSIPYYLFCALSTVLVNPLIGLAIASAVILTAIACLYIYLKLFKPCPKEVLFCENLSEKFKSGNVTPILAREQEYKKVLSILAMGQSKKAGNLVVIGNPGVGKSMFIEGLAERLPGSQVFRFNNWDLIEPDGRFRNPGGRMQMAFDEVKGFENQTLFCFDELGNEVEKNQGLANYLRMVLPESNIRFIACMTVAQWNKFKDKNREDGFEERFIPVHLEPTSSPVTENILRNIVKLHVKDISISDRALKKIVELTDKKISENHEQPRLAKGKLDQLIGKARLLDLNSFEIEALAKAKEELNILLEFSGMQESPLNDPFAENNLQHLEEIKNLKEKIKLLKVLSEETKISLATLKNYLDLLRNYEGEYKLWAKNITLGKCDEISLKQFAFAQFIATPALSKKIKSLKSLLSEEAKKICLYIDEFQVEHFLAENPQLTVI